MSPEKLKHEIGSVFTIVKERSSNEEVIILCPIPGCGDKTGNRSINLKTLRTHCWKCEGKQPGHVASLFKAMGLNFEDDHVLEPNEVQALLHQPKIAPFTPVQNVSLPDGFTLLSEDKGCCYWRFCKRMAEAKHLSIQDLEEAGAGFTDRGFWEPFCIFPVYEGQRLAYYQGRTYNDEGMTTTKKFPSKHTVKYGANNWLYGINDLNTKEIDLVILVESVLNRLSLKRRLRELDITGIVPICIFTHFLSPTQLLKILRYPNVREWCLLFDSDSTGLAHKTALNLNGRLPMPITVAEMPFGLKEDGTVRKNNDANDDVNMALDAITRRTLPESTYVMKHKRTQFVNKMRPGVGAVMANVNNTQTVLPGYETKASSRPGRS